MRPATLERLLEALLIAAILLCVVLPIWALCKLMDMADPDGEWP